MSETIVLSRLGAALHGWVSGASDAPLVALVHGATLDHHSFDAQLAPLLEAGYRVLAVDLRGHGQSTPMGQQPTAALFAEDLLALIDQLGASQVALVGHSLGGYVVQAFTHSYPERVSAVVTLGCTNLAQKPARAYRLLYRIFPRLLPRMSLDSFRRRTLQDLSLSDEVKAYAAHAMEGISKEDFIAIIMAGIECLWLDAGYDRDYVIPRPLLLSHGARDRANGGVFPKLSSAWAKREPSCRYETIPDAGHSAQMDNPAAFNALLVDFLRQHVAAGQ